MSFAPENEARIFYLYVAGSRLNVRDEMDGWMDAGSSRLNVARNVKRRQVYYVSTKRKCNFLCSFWYQKGNVGLNEDREDRRGVISRGGHKPHTVKRG